MLGERLRHLPAKFGEVEFRQPAVQDTLGLWTSPWRSKWTVAWGMSTSFSKGRGNDEIFYTK
jgi:hypothetical protein